MNWSKIHWLRLLKYPTHPYLQHVFDCLHEELKHVVHGGCLRVHELHPVLILFLGPLSTYSISRQVEQVKSVIQPSLFDP